MVRDKEPVVTARMFDPFLRPKKGQQGEGLKDCTNFAGHAIIVRRIGLSSDFVDDELLLMHLRNARIFP
jgi:hypothetical protein